MAITAPRVEQLVARELSAVTDERVSGHIRSLLAVPEEIPGHWDYGKPGEKYVCWYVLRHERSNTGIVYCEEGFGPQLPWGLVDSSGNTEVAIGMDAGWFETFMGAFFESFASADLPIWRVFMTNPLTGCNPISGELEWDVAWKQIEDLRARDPESSYNCDHSIKY